MSLDSGVVWCGVVAALLAVGGIIFALPWLRRNVKPGFTKSEYSIMETTVRAKLDQQHIEGMQTLPSNGNAGMRFEGPAKYERQVKQLVSEYPLKLRSAGRVGDTMTLEFARLAE